MLRQLLVQAVSSLCCVHPLCQARACLGSPPSWADLHCADSCTGKLRLHGPGGDVLHGAEHFRAAEGSASRQSDVPAVFLSCSGAAGPRLAPRRRGITRLERVHVSQLGQVAVHARGLLLRRGGWGSFVLGGAAWISGFPRGLRRGPRRSGLLSLGCTLTSLLLQHADPELVQLREHLLLLLDEFEGLKDVCLGCLVWSGTAA